MKHKLIELEEIKGAYLYKRKVFNDDRGSFAELFDLGETHEKIPELVGMNQSFSFGGVLRGMHMQKQNPQGKLVTCLYGTIHDVIIDGRNDSPTFGEGYSRVLDFKSLEGLYVPPGCFHGFLTLSKFAVVVYNTTTYYDQESDGGINWECPEVKKHFPSDLMPILSAKDRVLPSWTEYYEE